MNLNKLRELGESINRFFLLLAKALRYSWLSIISVGMVFLLMTQMAQGATIYIDMLDGNWLNLVLFYYLISSFAFIVSHYPVYIEKSLISDAGKWNMDKKNSLLGLGIITYSSKTEDRANSNNLIADALRKFMGILLIAVLVFIGRSVHFENIIKPTLPWDTDQSIGFLAFGKTLVLVSLPFVLVLLIKKYFRSLESKGIGTFNFDGKLIKDVSYPLNQLGRLLNILSLSIFLLVLLATVYATSVDQWSRASYLLFQASLVCFSFYYSCFRFFRKNSLLSKDTNYLRYLSISGFVSIFILILAHYKFELFNPFIIFLAQLNVFYGLIIIPKKHVLYYKQNSFKDARFGTAYYFRNIHVFVPYILLLWIVIADSIGNDLHLIHPIKQDSVVKYEESKTDKLVDLKRFNQEADVHFANRNKLFYIASYGGGLKANIWNMFLLDTLSHYQGKYNVLENTLAMSGVSGGALGQSMYTGFRYAQGNVPLKSRIREFGLKNLVSSDLVYVLGRDLLFEFVPGNLFAKILKKYGDREHLAIKRHDEFVDKKRFMSKKTFQELWSETFYRERAKGSFYPLLIANAAGTNTKRGIAASVYLENGDFGRTFFNSVDLTKYDEGRESISFFSPASISNRFPIFSPAAKLKFKGHFIDGGYFENSGMLSLEDMASALKRNVAKYRGKFNNSSDYTQIYQKHDSLFCYIQIANGRDEYIRKLLFQNQFDIDVKEASEISSILSTITSISFIPSYIQDKKRMQIEKNGSHYVELQLPYFIHKSDIENLIGGQIDKERLPSELIRAIENSNCKLRRLFGKDLYRYVQPPLARMLGRQSIAYMEKAMKDGDIFKELNKEIKWLEN